MTKKAAAATASVKATPLTKVDQAGAVMQYVRNFFNSPLWTDTIKDFVLENCVIFMGEGEFSHYHQECHKSFCEIVENTLNIYLLEVLGLSFEQFEAVLVSSAQEPQSIGAEVLRTLKQAVDFEYFAAKMYAANLMLDRQAQRDFVVSGPGASAFFQAQQEITRDEARLAITKVEKLEEEKGLPPTPALAPEPEAPAPQPAAAPAPAVEPPAPAPAEGEKPPAPKRAAKKRKRPTEPIEPSPSIGEVVTDEEAPEVAARLQRKREELAAMDPAEAAREREELERRKAEVLASERDACQKRIQASLRGRRAPGAPAADEDSLDAVRRVLREHVATLIDQE